MRRTNEAVWGILLQCLQCGVIVVGPTCEKRSLEVGFRQYRTDNEYTAGCTTHDDLGGETLCCIHRHEPCFKPILWRWLSRCRAGGR